MDHRTIPPAFSISRLIGELLGDCQALLRQHVQLLKDEIDAEITKAKRAARSVIIGGVLLAIGGLFFMMMSVHLLQWLTTWPLWICYGLIGFIFAAGGGMAISLGRRVGASVHVTPAKTLQSIKEDAQWITQTIASKKM